VDLDSNLGPRSSKRLAFGVAAVATIILETFDIWGKIKLLKLLEYLNSWNTSEIERSSVGLKKMGHFGLDIQSPILFSPNGDLVVCNDVLASQIFS